MVPDAGLPPPFPTSRPYTMYVSNMGVAREQRCVWVAPGVVSKDRARPLIFFAETTNACAHSLSPLARRRRGIARELLRACERAARRWGQGEVWLHVDLGNETAAKMYSALGYGKAGEDPWWWSERRILLKKEIGARGGAAAAAAGGAGGGGGGGASDR